PRVLPGRLVLQQHIDIHSCRREWTGLAVVVQHLVEDQAAARLEALETFPREKAALVGWPIVVDVAIEVQVGGREGLYPHVARLRPDAVLQAVSQDERLQRDLPLRRADGRTPLAPVRQREISEMFRGASTRFPTDNDRRQCSRVGPQAARTRPRS